MKNSVEVTEITTNVGVELLNDIAVRVTENADTGVVTLQEISVV